MKTPVLLSICVLFFCFGEARAQAAAENKLSIADQRRIIETLVNEKFERSAERTVYLSTVNIPEEIQNDLPALKDKTIELVKTRAAANDVCAYEFGEFQFIEKFVSVAFGNCREGLAYDFIRDGEGWKTVGLVVTRELFY